MIFGKALKYS